MAIDKAVWDPAVWRPALEKYGSVTRLTVALYDADRCLVCGPIHRTALFDLFAESGFGLFDECTERCLHSPHGAAGIVVANQFGLGAVGTALSLHGVTVGAAVAGYHLSEFPQTITIDRLAHTARLSPARLWDAV